MSSSETPPVVPEGVLVQSVASDGEGVEAGYRIYRDGRHETRPRGSDWMAGVLLDAGQVAAVERAITGSALDALPERLQGRSESGDPALLWFQAALGDTIRTVLVIGGLQVPELVALTAELMRVFDGASRKGSRPSEP